MPGQRFLFWIRTILFLAGCATYFINVVAGFGLLVVAVTLCFYENQRWRKSLRQLTLQNGNHVEITEVVKRFNEFDRGQRNLIEAIAHIGANDGFDHSSLSLSAEASKAISDLKGKLARLKLEEETRVWAARGIALVSEIRKTNSDLREYCYQIVSLLVKYLRAHQGAFYVYRHDGQDDFLELMGAYAYERRKHQETRIIITPGQGLMGQCVLSKEPVYLTEVPANFVKITSGLGESLPRCIFIMPLLFREEIYGAIEIASFETLDAFKIDFIKEACDSIAVELSSVKAQEDTRKLLEQSQEAELRKALEEMQATQFEMKQKEEELSEQLLTTQRAKAIAEIEKRKNEAILEGCMDGVISFDETGIVEYVNNAAVDIFGYSRAQLTGQSIKLILAVNIVNNDLRLSIRSASGTEVSARTEVTATTSDGTEISLLLTATQVKIEGRSLFTLFAQKVSVDLF